MHSLSRRNPIHWEAIIIFRINLSSVEWQKRDSSLHRERLNFMHALCIRSREREDFRAVKQEGLSLRIEK